MYNEVSQSDKLWKLLTIKDKNELDYLISNEKLLDSYGEKLTNLSRDKIYKEKIMWNETIERNLRRAEEYHSGLYDGEEKKQTEIVLNMHNDNLPIEQICKYTNLTTDEVQKIIDSQDK